MARMVWVVWLQVRDALKTLEGLTATARRDGMRPLEVLCTLFARVLLQPELVILMECALRGIAHHTAAKDHFPESDVPAVTKQCLYTEAALCS